MERIVVDTDVLINHARGKTRGLSNCLMDQEAKRAQLILPSVVVFEFYSGSSLEDSSAFDLAELLLSQFTVQELTESIAKKAAELNRLHTLYQKIGTADILIAATTLSLNAKLLTANRKHFSLVPGLKFFDAKS